MPQLLCEIYLGLYYVVYVVMLLAVLSGTFGSQGYSLHLYCFVIFFLHRSLITLRTLWTLIANLWKTVRSAAD